MPKPQRAAWRTIRQLVPPGVYESLEPLLADVSRILTRRSISSSDWRRQLRRSCCACSIRHPSLVHYAMVVFGYSPWLGETLIHNPDLFHGFVRERSLDRTHSREEFQESFARMRSRSFETDTAALLARFKRREYIRIMLRDVLGIATLAETTAEISALADVLIEEALREADSPAPASLRHPAAAGRGRPRRRFALCRALAGQSLAATN